MPLTTYKYQAWDTAEAKNVTGNIRAADEDDALDQLTRRGLIVSNVNQDKLTGVARTQINFRKPRVKPKDVAWLTRSLATTEAAGVPIFDAIGILGGQRRGTPIGDLLDDVAHRVNEGADLADAFDEHRESLGDMTVALIRAGIKSGDLAGSLERVADMQEQRQLLARKVRGAVMSPLVTLSIVTLVFIAIVVVVVPQFEEMYEALDSDLPAPTQLFIGFSGFVGRIAWTFPVFGFLAWRGYQWLNSHPEWGYKLDGSKLKLPIVGELLKANIIARSATTLGGLLTAGIDLIEALRHTEETAGNKVVAKVFRDAREAVQQGSYLSDALAQTEVLPEMFTQLTKLGERTGNTDEMLDRYAEVCRSEVETKVDGLTSALGPILGAGICILVGIPLLVLYMPLLGLAGEIQ